MTVVRNAAAQKAEAAALEAPIQLTETSELWQRLQVFVGPTPTDVSRRNGYRRATHDVTAFLLQQALQDKSAMSEAMRWYRESPPDGDQKADQELQAKLADPQLCIEEKLIAVFGRCLDRFTHAVDKQTQKIARMQQQQGEKGESVDVEVMQLKRLEDKRTEMLETGRKILGHYFGNAAQLTQSLGR